MDVLLEVGLECIHSDVSRINLTEARQQEHDNDPSQEVRLYEGHERFGVREIFQDEAKAFLNSEHVRRAHQRTKEEMERMSDDFETNEASRTR